MITDTVSGVIALTIENLNAVLDSYGVSGNLFYTVYSEVSGVYPSGSIPIVFYDEQKTFKKSHVKTPFIDSYYIEHEEPHPAIPESDYLRYRRIYITYETVKKEGNLYIKADEEIETIIEMINSVSGYQLDVGINTPEYRVSRNLSEYGYPRVTMRAFKLSDTIVYYKAEYIYEHTDQTASTYIEEDQWGHVSDPYLGGPITGDYK